MKRVSILIFVLSIWTTFAQNKSVQGDWLITYLQNGGKTGTPYIIQSFKADGKMLFRDYEIGTWEQSGDKLFLKSKLYPVFDGTFEITQADYNELIIKSKQTKATLIKYDLQQLQSDKQFQNLTGAWKFGGMNTNILRLRPDGNYTLLSIGEDMNMSTKGNWYYISGKNTFVLQGNPDFLSGKDTIVQHGKAYMEVINHELHYQLEKIPEHEPIEHLTFKEEDLPEENIDAEKLPWREFAYMKDYLSKIKTLRYNKYDYYSDVDAFVTTEIFTKIEQNDKSVKFTAYYYPNEEAVKLSETVKGFLQNAYNNFFPQKELDYYKVLDNKQKIRVPAGTFICTLVEGMTGDDKYQYWMINDKPGVFAKIIKENDGQFGNALYQKYELTEIIKK